MIHDLDKIYMSIINYDEWMRLLFKKFGQKHLFNFVAVTLNKRQEMRPRTVIELGTFTGGSALWMADSDIECNVFSIYLDHSLLHPIIKSLPPQTGMGV